MEHICRNCRHSESWDYPIKNIGSCMMLKQVKQALGDIPQDFITDFITDFNGEPIRKGSLLIREVGVSVGSEYGKDCEYFTSK